MYDRRQVSIKDAPMRGKLFVLEITKRRFWCKPCGGAFTEPISGISKGYRTTARYRRHLLWACENFSDLKRVRKEMRCSYSLLYKVFYEQLQRKQRMRVNYPWPKTIGIDEHSFKRNKKYGFTDFATVLVDHKNKRVFELVEGRSPGELGASLAKIKGRENVETVSLDLSAPYRKFITEFFPNASLVADKFHVLRLIHPAINKHRIAITGDKRRNPVRRLLLKDSKKLDYFEKSALYRWLNMHPELKEVYLAKEALHGFYRIKGYERAKRALQLIVDRLGYSKVKELITLRKTLMRWRKEILNYFKYRITNGRVEGFNGKAKLIKRKAYGYRSFKNYRLRVLHECC